MGKHSIIPLKYAFVVALLIITMYVIVYHEAAQFNMYLLVYSIKKYNDTSVLNATNLDVYYNYSVLLDKDYVHRNRIGFREAVFGFGNRMDKNSIGLQVSIYHHFYRADVSVFGVYYPDNFTRVALEHFPHYNPPEINHSLQVYRKIVLGFSHHTEFGHFLHDMLCPIISMPIEILEGSEIFVNFNQSQARNYFAFLGFDTDKIHQLTDKWVHGIDVHCAVSEFGINGNFQSWNELHDMIHRKYNFSKIKPTQHTAVNKPKGNWGWIGDMEQCVNIARELYPKYNWVYYPPSTAFNIPLMAKILAGSNLYLSAAGSACFNCVYMHRNTHVLFFTRYYTDNPAISCALTLGIYLFGICNKFLTEIKRQDFENGLHEIMFVIENGRWKDGINDRSKMIFDKNDYKKGFDIYNKTGKTNVFIQVVKRQEIPYRKIMSQDSNSYALSKRFYFTNIEV